MKKNISNNQAAAAAMQAAMNDIKEYYTASSPDLSASTEESTGEILGWNWEPLHDSYSFPYNIVGTA